MSAVYGGGGSLGYGLPRKVSFGWIGESWTLFGQSAGVWIVAMLVSAGIPLLVGVSVGALVGASASAPGAGGQVGAQVGGPLAALSGGLPVGVNLGIRVFSAVWTAFFYGGVYRMAVKQVRGEPIGFGDIFSGGSLFLNMLLFNIIYSLAAGIGFVLCLVPGLLVVGLAMPAYALLADGASLGDAISRSNEGMKGDMWNAALFMFVMGLLVVASALLLGLGLLVTVPMTYLVSALAYRDMVGMPGGGGAQFGGPAPGAYGTSQPGVWPPPPASGQAPPPNWGPPPGG